MNNITNKEYLDNTANKVFENLDFENGISLDPEVAEHMGAFEETAIGIIDVLDDILEGNSNE